MDRRNEENDEEETPLEGSIQQPNDEDEDVDAMFKCEHPGCVTSLQDKCERCKSDYCEEHLGAHDCDEEEEEEEEERSIPQTVVMNVNSPLQETVWADDGNTVRMVAPRNRPSVVEVIPRIVTVSTGGGKGQLTTKNVKQGRREATAPRNEALGILQAMKEREEEEEWRPTKIDKNMQTGHAMRSFCNCIRKTWGDDEANAYIKEWDGLDKCEKVKHSRDIFLSKCINIPEMKQDWAKAGLGIGSERFRRIRSGEERKKGNNVKSNSVNDTDRERIGDHLNNGLVIEQGFATCTGLINNYIGGEKSVAEDGTVKVSLFPDIKTWQHIYRLYQAYCVSHGWTPLLEATWCKWRSKLFPEVKLRQTQQDLCDTCGRLEIVLANPRMTDPERLAAVTALEIHRSSAKEMRTTMRNFSYTLGKKNPVILGEKLNSFVQLFGGDLGDLPEVDEDEANKVILTTLKAKYPFFAGPTMMHITDFGAAQLFPIFGARRFSKDYYTSSLSLKRLFNATMEHSMGQLYVFDERLMKVNDDCLCSLRWMIYSDIYKVSYVLYSIIHLYVVFFLYLLYSVAIL